MTTTLSNLVTQVDSELENSSQPGSDTAVGDGDTTAFSIAPIGRFIVEGGLIACEVDGVSTSGSMDYAAGVWTFASPPAVRAAIAWSFNYVNWPGDLVREAVNAGIGSLFPAFYVPKADTTISIVDGQYEYDLKPEVEFVVAVDNRPDASGSYTKLARHKYELLADGDHKVLRFYSAPSGYLRVRCINRPSLLSADTDTLEAVSGLPTRAKDPIISYACYHLLLQKTAPRVRSDVAVAVQGMGNLSPRQMTDAVQAWFNRFQFQLAAMKMPPWMGR